MLVQHKQVYWVLVVVVQVIMVFIGLKTRPPLPTILSILYPEEPQGMGFITMLIWVGILQGQIYLRQILG